MREKIRRGAILADALVAAFILSVGLLAAVGLFIQVSQAEGNASRQEHAACFAAEGMERLRHWGTEEWTTGNLADAAESGQMDADGVRFERTTTLRPRLDLDSAGNLLEAEVRVTWLEKTQERKLVLVTYFVVDTSLEGLR